MFITFCHTLFVIAEDWAPVEGSISLCESLHPGRRCFGQLFPSPQNVSALSYENSHSITYHRLPGEAREAWALSQAFREHHQQYCTAAAGLAGKRLLWRLETFWAESGTYLVQEGVPQSASNQKSICGWELPSQMFLCAGIWQLAAAHSFRGSDVSVGVQKRENE